MATAADPRIAQGRLLLTAGRLEDAVEYFGEMLQMVQAELQSAAAHAPAGAEADAMGAGEYSPALGPFYYEYGNALLTLVEESGTMFGDAVREAEKAKQQIKDDLAAAFGTVAAEAGGSSSGDAGGDDAEAAEEAAEEGDDVEDVQVAFENLEMARMVFERDETEKGRRYLAKVRMRPSSF